MHKIKRLKNNSCLLFYIFADLAIFSKFNLLSFCLARMLFFGVVFNTNHNDGWKFLLFLNTFPLYALLLACLSYELSVNELMLLARATLRA